MASADETPAGPVVKRFLYVNRKAPHGTVYALESLEMVLIAAVFEQDVHVVFLDDGVFQLKKNQNPNALGMKDFSKTFRALETYDIENIYVERESMEARGLTPDDFLIPVKVLDRNAMANLMNTMDVVLSS
jgi:tRNA 2-thiouridine synthesizing protein C